MQREIMYWYELRLQKYACMPNVICDDKRTWKMTREQRNKLIFRWAEINLQSAVNFNRRIAKFHAYFMREDGVILFTYF